MKTSRTLEQLATSSSRSKIAQQNSFDKLCCGCRFSTSYLTVQILFKDRIFRSFFSQLSKKADDSHQNMDVCPQYGPIAAILLNFPSEGNIINLFFFVRFAASQKAFVPACAGIVCPLKTLPAGPSCVRNTAVFPAPQSF